MTKTDTKDRPKYPVKIGHSDDDPALVLTWGDLALISAALKRNVISRTGLIEGVTAMNAVSVEGIQIPLEPRLLERLKSRCLDKPNFPRWLAQVVVKQLHDYAGW